MNIGIISGDVNIDSNGIHIKDEDGQEVHVTKSGIKIKDEEGESRKVKVTVIKDKKQRLNALISLITTFGVIIAYILLGTIAGLWGQAWVLFLLVIIIPSIFDSIYQKKFRKFSYAATVVFVYLLLNVWVLEPPLWHPLWVMFVTIPVFYAITSFIKHFRDPDEDIEIECKDDD